MVLGEVCRIRPVSYTHLDVYKRQIIMETKFCTVIRIIMQNLIKLVDQIW